MVPDRIVASFRGGPLSVWCYGRLPATRLPQRTGACANAAPAPFGVSRCSAQNGRAAMAGVWRRWRVQGIGPVFPRFAPAAADFWRIPRSPAAGFGLALKQLGCIEVSGSVNLH